MKKIVFLVFALLLTIAVLVACGKTSGTDKKVVSTDGSTSMEKMIGSLGEAYEQKDSAVKVTYNPTGSSSGITSVLEGRSDIGLSSRTLNEEEKKSGLIEKTVAYDGIAIIVNRENGIENLSKEQISDIFTGKIKNWNEVGGMDKEIVLIGREAGSGTRDGFESITGTKDTCKYRQELSSTGDVITTVSGNDAAIGYASLASIKESVKVLNIDEVIPTEKSILDGSYGIQRPFVIVTNGNKKASGAAEKFLEYVFSEKAYPIIKSAGVVPAGLKEK
ncbi:MAG: phosphate ABC transporter substrate-binding protein [Eubacterium sp.]|nr:phosphate ABC transporter substrate-binding protein [Eubacterium sp.]